MTRPGKLRKASGQTWTWRAPSSDFRDERSRQPSALLRSCLQLAGAAYLAYRVTRASGANCPPAARAGSRPRLLNQTMLEPPSTARYWPVTWRAAWLARNTTAPLRSSSSPRRWSGVWSITICPTLSSSPADIFEGKKPGQIAFTLMLYLPHSAASARVKLMAAAFDVLYAIACIGPSEPFRPAIDATLMILPRWRGIMLR